MLELRRTWKSGDSPGLARATQRCVAQLYTLDHANTGTQRAIARILRDEVELARGEVEFRDLLEELNIPRSRGISAIARFGGVEATRREVAMALCTSAFELPTKRGPSPLSCEPMKSSEYGTCACQKDPACMTQSHLRSDSGRVARGCSERGVL